MAAIRNGQLSYIDNAQLKTVDYWQWHNDDVLRGDVIRKTDENSSITKNCIVKANRTACNDFDDSTNQLSHRARHINYWKCELETAISSIDEETNLLKAVREQLRNAVDTLKTPELVTIECLDLRRHRMQSDMVYDEAQDALYNEFVLIEDVKRLHADASRKIEDQLRLNEATRDSLIGDWSDKRLAFTYESNNAALETKSVSVKHTPGAARLSEGQSNVRSWEQRTVTTLKQYKDAVDACKKLREGVNAMLMNSARDLRTQDVKVNKALSDRIARTERVKTQLENQLKLTLDKISETENVLETLHEERLKISQRMQVAQTRLNCKSIRPYVENCREGSLFGLIDEVRDLNDSLTLLHKRSEETQKVRAELLQERSKLENEIIVKKKSLYIDNERCLFLRSHYLSAEKLCGY